jgi:hypothetical protein
LQTITNSYFPACKLISALTLSFALGGALLANDDAPARPKRFGVCLGGVAAGDSAGSYSGYAASIAVDFFRMKYFGMRGRVGFQNFGSLTLREDPWNSSSGIDEMAIKKRSSTYTLDFLCGQVGSSKGIYGFYGMGACNINADMRYAPSGLYDYDLSGSGLTLSLGVGKNFRNGLTLELIYTGAILEAPMADYDRNRAAKSMEWGEFSIGYRF